MYQKKGGRPNHSMPSFKIALPVSPVLKSLIITKLEDLDLLVTEKQEGEFFLYHKNGVMGHGSDYSMFLENPSMEMHITEVLSYEKVPLRMTKKEIEGFLGHELEIIEEVK